MKVQKAILAGAVLAPFVFGSPALAQRTGTRIGRDATPTDSVLAMRIIADCYADRRPQVARAWLAALPGSPEETKIGHGDRESIEACMKNDRLVLDGKMLSFRAETMRRPLAMAMVRSLLKRDPNPPAPAADSKLWFEAMIKPAAAGRDVAFSTVEISWQEVGSCVVQARWNNSIELLETDIGTPQERAAVATIVPAIGPCIPQGMKLSLTRDMIRYIIAEPAYHFLVGGASPITAADAK